MSTGQYRNKIENLLPSNNNKEISASKLRETLRTGADVVDMIYQIANDPAKVLQMEEILELALDARDEAIQAKADAILGQNPLGEYNVATNTPPLTATPPAGANGSYYTLTGSNGNVGFAGSNFASGAAFSVGGRLTKKGTQWYYQPPSDLALTKVTALEGLAAKIAETVNSNINIVFRDANGNVIYAIYPDGTTYPPTPASKVQPFELSASTLSLIDKNKLVDSAPTNILTCVKDAAGYVLSAVLADGYPYPPSFITAKNVGVTVAAKDVYFDDNYDYIQGTDTYSKRDLRPMGFPVGYYDGECLYVGSVGAGKAGRNQGEIKISQKRDDGLIRSTILGNVRSDLSFGLTDDHNVPVIRYDDREGATNPIQIYQSEHNTHPTRIFRQSSKNIAKWDKSYTTFWR